MACVDNETASGALFDVTGGWVGQTRWQRSGGYGFPTNKPYTMEDVFSKWSNITAFGTVQHSLNFNSVDLFQLELDDGRATYPTSTQEAMEQVRLSSCLGHI